ncbi:MAG TPA: MMPL family transporter [Thermoplasmata archaeon]|nr:MMPL family transporter [Thermoplasmata archaeon]
MSGSGADSTFGARAFGRLGRGIQKHPWYPVVFWILLLLIALPLLPRVGTVTTNSATTLPNSAPSAVAAREIAQLYPNGTAASASYVLLVGSNITSPQDQAATVAVTAKIDADRSLTYLAGVSTVYSAYGGYLGGLAQLANGVIVSGTSGPDSVLPAVNGSAQLLWGPPALFLANWEAIVAAHPGAPASDANAPAYNQTLSELPSNSSSVAVLNAFYSGPYPSNLLNTLYTGFNGSKDCAANVSNVVVCADWAAGEGGAVLLPTLFPNTSAQAIAGIALATLGVENYTNASSLHVTTAAVLASGSGLSTGWILDVWDAWPAAGPSAAAASRWAATIANTTPVADYPVPIPIAIRQQFLSADGTATLLIVAYSKDDGYTTPSGATPIFDDVLELNRVVPAALTAAGVASTVSYYQTGGAALDQNESTDLSSSLSIVLPLTLLVLVLITIAYFRAPLAPLITFGALGLALGLATAGVVVVGTLVAHVDVTSIELVTTFVLGVGTDYAIFLVARYREELIAGRTPQEALITSTTWAGQSIATSGGTAILATLALTLSGVTLLSQWGSVLSLAILITVLISLTLIPALLTLIGPRIFWPETGAKFEAAAARRRSRVASEAGYFYRAGRLSQRRPKTIIAVVLLLSIPLLYVAINVPESYDFYGQLPAGHPATDGLAELNEKFGSGFAFPSDVLVTFSAPLVVGATPNPGEFGDIAALTRTFAGTPGVDRVGSPVGPTGAGLGAWLNWSTAPPAVQAMLSGTLASYLGNDGRTIWFTVISSSPGLSADSVHLLHTIASETSSFAASHPEVTGVAYGGGASETSDIQAQTSLALQRMAILVSIGLLIVLFVALRSYLIPPMAVATIGLSIGWSWAVTYLVLDLGFGVPLFYFVPVILFVLILGLGIDYNIFLLTRVREERLRGRTSTEAVVEAVGRTGAIITAAAVILASAFAILITGNFLLLRAIGFAVATAIVLDAMVVRTYLVPALLHVAGDRVWGLRKAPAPASPAAPAATADVPP